MYLWRVAYLADTLIRKKTIGPTSNTHGSIGLICEYTCTTLMILISTGHSIWHSIHERLSNNAIISEEENSLKRRWDNLCVTCTRDSPYVTSTRVVLRDGTCVECIWYTE